MQPIFVVDDEKMITTVLERALGGAGYTVHVFHDAEQALAELNTKRPFLVLLDLQLPGMNGLEALERIRDIAPETEVVMISGYGSIDVAVEAIKRGAADFLSKPVQLPEVMLRVSRIYETLNLREEVSSLRRKQRDEFFASYHQGESPLMDKLYRTARQAARYPNLVALVTGASGSGKEMLARYLHYAGSNADGPFVAINCAAIPAELIESELFGYEAGAFTDARAEGKKGLIETAAAGTLFLDEIGELGGPAQAKLLRFFEDRMITRLGEAVHATRIECNVMTATNCDLEAMVAAGSFREDLYYRINVVRLHVPPLSERPEDILSFAESFLKQFHQTMGRRCKLEESACQKLLFHQWPGNLRELRNVLERACLLCEDQKLTAKDLLINVEEVTTGIDAQLGVGKTPLSLNVATSSYARQVLDFVGGNKSEAARLLKISRNRLKRILNEK